MIAAIYSTNNLTLGRHLGIKYSHKASTPLSGVKSGRLKRNNFPTAANLLLQIVCLLGAASTLSEPIRTLAKSISTNSVKLKDAPLPVLEQL